MGALGTHAILNTSGEVVNIVVSDSTFAAEQGWTDLTSIEPQPGIGWKLTNGMWTAPPPPVSPTSSSSATTATSSSGTSA